MRGDLQPHRPSGPPVGIVQVGPGAGGVEQPGDARIADGNSLPPVDVFRPRGTPQDLVAQNPQDFTNVGDGRRPPAGQPVPPVTPPKTYVAESGDTVSRIAQKQMAGGNSKANREALIKANPTLQNEGNVVFVGKMYVIPSPGATAQAGDAVAGKPVTPATPTPAPTFPAPPAAQPNTVWYTVKDNDNLWRIASRELGDGNLWTAIRDINKDVLKGGETVKANMRIRLPQRGSATASVN
jgi:nucleoid-associated protein YgaU